MKWNVLRKNMFNGNKEVKEKIEVVGRIVV